MWNLKGILIGNGWIHGSAQYPAYLRYAYSRGILTRGTPAAQAVEAKMSICSAALLNSGGADRVNTPECDTVLSEILFQTSSTSQDGVRTCYNLYDVRLRDKHPSCGLSWPPDLESVTPYLRQRDVMRALHVNRDVGWQECKSQVSQAFSAAHSGPLLKLLPSILLEILVVLKGNKAKVRLFTILE
jgi:carboxypeptidase D